MESAQRPASQPAGQSARSIKLIKIIIIFVLSWLGSGGGSSNYLFIEKSVPIGWRLWIGDQAARLWHQSSWTLAAPTDGD